MRDHLNEELITAYIDGELADDERELVERKLRESAEHLQLLKDLQGLSSSFAGLPRFRLPADFHLRVLDQIEHASQPPQASPFNQAEDAASGSPDCDSPSKPAPATRRQNRVAVALLTVAAIAAAIVAAVALNRPPGDNQNVVQQQDPEKDQAPREPFVPDDSWYDDQYVYYLPNKSPSTLTSSIDVVLTRQGQANRVFEEVFRRAGVPIDPELTLDEDLEQAILKSEQLGKVQAVPGGDDDQDEVDLVYVICETDKATRIISDFYSLYQERDEVAWCHWSLLQSEDLERLYRLNRSSVGQFAGPDSNSSKRSLFHRLALSVKLTSTSLPDLARTPTPGLRLAFPDPDSPGWVESLKQAPTELLFIIRKLK